MLAPLMGGATDVYRQGLDSIQGGFGDIRTGSAAKRRKEFMEDYGQRMTDIRLGVKGARSKASDKLVGRIAKLFQG